MFRKILDRLSNSTSEVAELPTEQPAVEQPAIVGSERSQQSLLKEAHLRRVMKQFTDAKELCENDIVKLEAEKARAARQMFDAGFPSAEARFKDAVAQIAHERELIASYEKEIAANQAGLDALIPSPEQVRERQEQQNQVAQLAAERLKKDRTAYAIIQELRRVLEQRGELSTAMRELSRSLDLTVPMLDQDRFNAVLNALPENRFSESEAWRDWFVGKGDALTEYVVIEDELRIRETLSASGFYTFGDRIKLQDAEARELLREDRPQPHRSDEPWSCKLPSIMTVEAFEALTRKAQEEGETVKLALLWIQHRRDEKSKPAYDEAD